MRSNVLHRGKSPSQMQLENRSTLLNLLRTNSNVCRKDLAEMSGLTAATVTNLIRDLIEVGLVREDYENKGQLGRNSVPLKINYEEFLVIGVTVRRGLVSYALADLGGRIVEKASKKFSLEKSVNSVLEDLSASVQAYVTKYGASRRIAGIGISVPGPTNLKSGEIFQLSNVPGWKAIPIKRYLEDRFPLPVVMDEDANAAALAEYWFGCGKERRNMASILVGKGVGAGLVLDGRIYHGAFGFAGEVGHVSIDFNGPQCDCGNRGCLELYCSTLALLRKSQELYGSEEITDLEDLKRRVKLQDEKIMDLVRENGRYMGYAVANLVNAFNPELVVLHGDMADFGELWLNEISETARNRLPGEVYSGLEIRLSTIPEDPVLLGTAAIVCEYLFANPALEHFSRNCQLLEGDARFGRHVRGPVRTRE